jgi:RecB family exonuclease
VSVFLPQHLSVSSVALYARCPAQWKRRYVDRISDPSTAAQATGIAFHKALEALHRGEDGELAWLTAADNMEALLAQSSQSLTMSKEHGLKLLKLYREYGLDTVRGEPERMFRLTVQASKLPVPLLGYIDLAVPSERQFRDFKTTGGTYWNAAKVALEPQVAVYGWAYQKLYHHRADTAIWCVFNTQTVTLNPYEVVPSPDAFRVFLQTAEMVWQGIKSARYEGCGTCSLCRPRSEKVDKVAPSFAWEEPS